MAPRIARLFYLDLMRSSSRRSERLNKTLPTAISLAPYTHLYTLHMLLLSVYGPCVCVEATDQ